MEYLKKTDFAIELRKQYVNNYDGIGEEILLGAINDDYTGVMLYGSEVFNMTIDRDEYDLIYSSTTPKEIRENVKLILGKIQYTSVPRKVV